MGYRGGPEWVQKFFFGVDPGVSLERLVVLKEDATWALIRRPGCTGWSGVGSRSYSPVEYLLCRKMGRGTSTIPSLSGRQSKKSLDAFWESRLTVKT